MSDDLLFIELKNLFKKLQETNNISEYNNYKDKIFDFIIDNFIPLYNSLNRQNVQSQYYDINKMFDNLIKKKDLSSQIENFLVCQECGKTNFIFDKDEYYCANCNKLIMIAPIKKGSISDTQTTISIDIQKGGYDKRIKFSAYIKNMMGINNNCNIALRYKTLFKMYLSEMNIIKPTKPQIIIMLKNFHIYNIYKQNIPKIYNFVTGKPFIKFSEEDIKKNRIYLW